MKKLAVFALSAVMGLALTPASAKADPIVGSVGFGGVVTPDPGPGLDNSTTGLSFVGAFVSSGTDDYAVIPVGTLATFSDFTFSPFGGPVSPLWALSSGGVDYSFDLESISVEDQPDHFLVLSGTGTLHMTGKDDTFGTWRFTASNAATGNLFTFSSNTGVPGGGGEGEGAVPEPASLLLLGLGLTAVASRMARQRR